MLTNTDRAWSLRASWENLTQAPWKIYFNGKKNWLFCSLLSAYIVCPLRSSLMPWKSNKGTPRRTSFLVFKLCRAVFWQNRQKLFINSPYLTQINHGMFWLLRNSSLFSGGWVGGCFVLFFFKVAIMMDNSDPSQKKKIIIIIIIIVINK